MYKYGEWLVRGNTAQSKLRVYHMSWWCDAFAKNKQMHGSSNQNLTVERVAGGIKRWEAISLVLWLFLSMSFNNHAGSLKGNQKKR